MEENNSLFDLSVDGLVKNHLNETAKWGKFLAIMGIIGCSFLVVFALYFIVAADSISEFESYNSKRLMGAAAVTAGIVYIIMAAIYFFPCLYLLRFAVKMKQALLSDDQALMADGFKNLKMSMRFVGIVTIVFVALFVLGLMAGVLGSAT